jgi:dihydroneopterin aldolase
MATLVLSRLTFEGRHGATEEERKSLRTFEVDITIDASMSAARTSDDLDDTIDYRTVAEIIVRLGTEEVHHLIESLAGRMLDQLRETFPLAHFQIELRKLCPPGCPGQPAYAAVRMATSN